MREEELKKIWAKHKPGYYDHANIAQIIWHGLKFRSVAQFIPKEKIKLLDVGCADGYFLNQVGKSFPKAELYGIDVSEKLIDAGKTKHPKINFITGDCHRLPYKNSYFDLIICTEVLEHLVNPTKALKEMERVIKKDGAIIIELDSGSILFKSIWVIWTKYFKGRIWQKAHLQSFDITKLEKLFKQVNLRIKKKKISHLGMAVTFLLKKN